MFNTFFLEYQLKTILNVNCDKTRYIFLICKTCKNLFSSNCVLAVCFTEFSECVYIFTNEHARSTNFKSNAFLSPY